MGKQRKKEHRKCPVCNTRFYGIGKGEFKNHLKNHGLKNKALKLALQRSLGGANDESEPKTK